MPKQTSFSIRWLLQPHSNLIPRGPHPTATPTLSCSSFLLLKPQMSTCRDSIGRTHGPRSRGYADTGYKNRPHMLTTLHVTLTLCIDPFEALFVSFRFASFGSIRLRLDFISVFTFFFVCVFHFLFLSLSLRKLNPKIRRTGRGTNDAWRIDRDLVRVRVRARSEKERCVLIAMAKDLFQNWLGESLLCLNWWRVRGGISSATRTVIVLLLGKTTHFHVLPFCIVFLFRFFEQIVGEKINNKCRFRTDAREYCYVFFLFGLVEKLRWWLDGRDALMLIFFVNTVFVYIYYLFWVDFYNYLSLLMLIFMHVKEHCMVSWSWSLKLRSQLCEVFSNGRKLHSLATIFFENLLTVFKTCFLLIIHVR